MRSCFMADEKPVGEVTHFFTNISVAVIKLSGKLAVGDRIKIKGAASDFTQGVDSMQVEHKAIKTAGKGQSVGMKVKNPVHEGDLVYKV